MSEPTITQIRTDLKQLRQLIEQLGGAVDQQQTMLTTQIGLSRQHASQVNEQVVRLFTMLQRNLESLEQRVKAQEKEHQQLRALQEIGAAINSSLDLQQVLSFVMDAIITLTHAERALLLLIDEETGQPEVQVARNVDRETIEKSASFEISRSIVRTVAETGEPVVTMNAQADPRFSAQESIISYNLRSILCVPLKIKDTITGVIYADNRVASGIFSDADRDLLAAFANQAAVAIENARLFRQIRDHLAEITEMKELMDNVFASIASGVITIDEHDRITLYNHAAERILGVPADSVLHQVYREALNALGLPVDTLVERVKQNGDVQQTELDVVVGKRPGVITLNLTCSPLRDIQERPFGVAMVLNDLSEKKRLESVRRYLPPELVDKVRDIDAAQRPQRREISVLFADVRGFSTFSEHLDPEKLIQIINGYFTEAVRAISHYQGLTDKFMGDAVMALFNTPLNPQENHVERAVRTAMMIQEGMAAYHAVLPEDRRLYFGIGVHTGEAVVGNVGSNLRKDYSAIGDAVNLAKRLQELAKPGQIIISDEVYAQIQSWADVRPLPPTQVKGRQSLEQLYELIGEK
ncbi:MAG: adenylate/guanylate cyclase domain-containing protein [Chloroflexi bacterium]|nr:MAG: adenylate/guanylate cyclase domain-containing protein [Chloroflexota bacterium]